MAKCHFLERKKNKDKSQLDHSPEGHKFIVTATNDKIILNKREIYLNILEFKKRGIIFGLSRGIFMFGFHYPPV